MTKNFTKTYKVKISYVYVSKISGDPRGSYSFDFHLYENGKLKEWGNLDGTFTNPDYMKPGGTDAFRKLLKRGYAHQLVLQKYY